ncbi:MULTISPECIES: ABC transporter ATP-binding protein [unclassified Streptomyces]|uniref:ABC transporter ATP-binding protein n=1 Tax=unclassified Streptomyces TaxID=2593676 RepID=UPI00093CF700|nr:ABC transporter ATP-binding protein [Streptomyces sp. TSRI0107]OKJ89400.1 ABC transporter ATP-binding protein [Streptomyces sp. TSRI0107]
MSHDPDRYREPAGPPTDTPAVRIEGLTVTAPDGRLLLTDAALALRPGRVTALTGPSGSGKTTLLRAVTGLLPPGTRRTAGQVEVLGQDVFALTEKELRALRSRRLAYVGQDPGSGLNPRMRVRSLVRELSTDRAADTVTALLAEVRLPDDGRLAARRPAALSGGQQRRVALARALARRPDVLLLDEPTAGLHPELREEIGSLLRHLAAEHRLAICLSCHDPELVERIADDVVELGSHLPGPRAAATALRPVGEGGDVHVLPAERIGDEGAAPGGRVPVPGAAVTAVRPLGEAGDVPVLEARDLGVSFGRRRGTVPALDGVGLSVAADGATGIVGASGSGKTTLVRAVVGLQPVTSGTLRLDGRPLSTGLRGRAREERRRIQLVTQNPLGALNPSRTIGAAIGRPLRLHRRCTPAEAPGRVADLLEQVGLPPAFADRYPHELSGGQRQRVAIARALAADPDVLICDEVTSALDSDTAEAIMDLLTRLRTERGTALVLISHDLPLVADRTDTVTVLDAGRVVEAGATGEVFAAPKHAATRALLGSEHAARRPR